MAFEVISQDTWERALKKYGIKTGTTVEELKQLKPARSTSHAAGYDFRMPFDLECEVDKEYTVPTGFKWNPSGAYTTVYTVPNNMLADPEYYPWYRVLVLAPRSSLGFKHGFTLLNTIGVIDADYYNNEANEGHILVKFKVEKELDLRKGQMFCQGMIIPFLLDGEDNGVNIVRTGGIGSTDK